LRKRTAGRLDDEETIGGPHNHAPTEVTGRHDETVSRPSMCLRHSGHSVRAGRLTALTPEPADEIDALAVQRAPRLARAKPLGRRHGRDGARSICAAALRGCHYWCYGHAFLPVIEP
jgi:hypothetical protein